MKKALIGHIHDDADGTRAFAWTTFTPTWTQGATVTHTVKYARYCLVGKVAFVRLHLVATGAGTASNAMVIGGIPAVAAIKDTAVTVPTVGSFSYLDSGTAYYVGSAVAASASGVNIYRDGGGAAFGTAITAASTDEVSLDLMYEIA